ncbi:EGF-like domain-containing protein [Caenorhabditis elegans]|nr:EGF-like domain-containing protein [Caenorhabditis elegans]CAB63388.1 EGF-like domain-containing protein [Caenorhabditis elegans]|eukprot:NP_001023481.1 Uncharacterized protein CELE_Y51H4A.25 [Caenorhabditis elegans]
MPRMKHFHEPFDEKEALIDENCNDVEIVPTFKYPKRKRTFPTVTKLPKYLLLFFGSTVICLCIFYISRPQLNDNFDPNISDKRKIRIYEDIIDAMRNRKKSGNFYIKRPETQHVDCGRILNGDKEYLQTFSNNNRIPLIKNSYLNMSCSSLQSRIQPEQFNFKTFKSGSVAFARIVFEDYEFIEKQVQMSWHPDNVFCFVIDTKSSKEFKTNMKKLADCFENIIVLPSKHSFDSSGHNQNLGHTECMQSLLQFENWTYLLLLQNHDVISKSVYELARIFEILGGANDVNIGKEIDQRRVPGLKWDPKNLKLFRNESGLDDELLKKPMKIASGYVQASLSRAAVEWLINTVDLTLFINQFDRTKYGGDEQLISSFQVNSQFEMPGHFTDECSKYRYGHDQISRMTQWAGGDVKRCASKTIRHGICLIGIEDFRAVSEMPVIMFNKMLPSFDYSIIDCTAELLFNRTFLNQTNIKLNEKYYEEMVTVIYHKDHKNPGYHLNCTPSHQYWKYENYL